MRNCDQCFYRNSEDCSKLTCIGFRASGSIDQGILENASEEHDRRMHRQNKYGSREFQKKQELIKNIIHTPSAINSTIESDARSEAEIAALVADLKRWRRDEAQKTNRPAFYIFPDATLQNIARANIHTKSDLMFVSGIGQTKYTQYGDAVYQIVKQHNRPF